MSPAVKYPAQRRQLWAWHRALVREWKGVPLSMRGGRLQNPLVHPKVLLCDLPPIVLLPNERQGVLNRADVFLLRRSMRIS